MKTPSRLRRTISILVRIVYSIVLLAAVDSLSAHYRGNTLFSHRGWTMRDGGSAFYIGAGYSMTFWRKMSGEKYGPEIWFWFTPFKISFASKNPELRWIWR